MDIGVSAFNSSSSQVNNGIYDLGGGVFIDPTVAPIVSGGQGGSSAGGPGIAGQAPVQPSNPASSTTVAGQPVPFQITPTILIVVGILVFVLLRR